MARNRLENEVEHGKYLAQLGSGELWYWASAAGQIRLERRRKVLTAHITPEMKVLELGCGPGYFSRSLAETKAQIVSIDISPDLIDYARKQTSASNIEFKVENAYELNYPDASFDTIVGNSVLHHLEMDQAFTEMYRVLKPGSKIKFIEPNWANPLQIMELSTPLTRRLSRHSPDEIAIVRWSMKKMLLRHGFKNISVRPFDFLHPGTPKLLIPFVSRLGFVAEKMPLLKEISGSLVIEAEK